MTFILASAGQGSDLTPALEKPLGASSTYAEQQGALLIDDGSGNWVVCGADPTLIGAVAATAGGADTSSLGVVGGIAAGGFNIRGRKEFPTGFMQAYPVQNNERFRAKYVGTVPTTLGGNYGVVRDTDGFWKVDFTDTVNVRVKLVALQNASPESQPYSIVSFLTAFVQQN